MKTRGWGGVPPPCYQNYQNSSPLNMVAYVMLPIVISVLVYSLNISEVAVTLPDTSCFIPHRNALCWTNCHYTNF